MKKALLQLHAAVFLFGFTGILGRLISLNEGMLVWWRMGLTVATLLLLRWWKNEFEKLSWKDALSIAGAGTLLALHWVAFYGSIKVANVSIALTCMAASGIFTALLEPFAFKKRLDLRELMLGIMALAGIALIFHFNPQYKLGIIVGIISVVLVVIFSMYNKKLVGRFSAKTVALYELGGGWLSWTLLLPLYNHFAGTTNYLPVRYDWLWLLIMAWFCTVLAVNLSLQSLRHLSVFTQNLTFNLEPVYGIALAFAIFKENQELTPGFYAGLILIFTAVVWQMFRITRPVSKSNYESSSSVSSSS